MVAVVVYIDKPKADVRLSVLVRAALFTKDSIAHGNGSPPSLAALP